MLQSTSHSKNDENQEMVMTTEEITEEVTNAEIDTSLLEIERPTTCEMASQTEWPETTSVQISETSRTVTVTTCDVGCQFPLDITEEALSDHTYVLKTIQNTAPSNCLPDNADDIEKDSIVVEDGYDSQVELFPDLDDDAPPVRFERSECVKVNSEVELEVKEPMDIIVSQETATSGSQYTPSLKNEDGFGTCSSQDSQESNSDSANACTHNTYKERVFMVYEEQLKELLRFCPKCGSLIIPESTVEVQNEGSQLSLKLTCINNCEYLWQSQPPLPNIKGAGNLLFTAGIFFCGIPFSKFAALSKLINLKFIAKGTYFKIREQYIFPVVRTTWQQQQQEIFSELKDREGGAVLAGDGRCDSPGHCAKYCTYTFLDVTSQKVIDFNVVSVSQVANSNQMEKKGFVDTLANIEANDIEVKLISTDRHTQIKKEMRVNHANIDHQFDPWHLAKTVSKKLSAASKKSGCSDLAPWIPSIVNHLWWCAESCNKDPEVLREKWLSVMHHVTNRHSWPGNRHFHKCDHPPLSPEQQRKKKWLKPGSAAHTALVNIVKDKLLLKDIIHLTQFVHTTALEVYHSMYLKYLPKLQHFTHDVMKVGTMLAALDHNNNVNRPQVSFLRFSPFCSG